MNETLFAMFRVFVCPFPKCAHASGRHSARQFSSQFKTPQLRDPSSVSKSITTTTTINHGGLRGSVHVLRMVFLDVFYCVREPCRCVFVSSSFFPIQLVQFWHQ